MYRSTQNKIRYRDLADVPGLPPLPWGVRPSAAQKCRTRAGQMPDEIRTQKHNENQYKINIFGFPSDVGVHKTV